MSRLFSILSPVSCLVSRVSCLVLILLAFALRVYALDAKGLSYDEAATALMARATPAEIIAFHWRAAFEHPPLWQLLMHGWSLLAGQSEFALRYLPVLAGTLLLPLTLQFARRLQGTHAPFTIHNLLSVTAKPTYKACSEHPQMRREHLGMLTTRPCRLGHVCSFCCYCLLLILVVSSPILIYYSQEARMYALVVTLAVAALIALLHLVDSLVTLPELSGRADRRPFQGDNRADVARLGLGRGGAPYTVPLRWVTVTFILLHWAMLGSHYYSALLLLAEGIFCLIWLVTQRATVRQWLTLGGTLALAMLPLLAWFAMAPGFHDTVRMVLAGTTPKPSALIFLTAFWREMSFAAVRWEVAESVWGYLWLPLVGLGVVALLGKMPPLPTSPACGGGDLDSLPDVGEGRGGVVAQHRMNSTPDTQNALKRIDRRVQLWLLLLTALLPIGLSALFFPALATRYLLYVVPFLLILMALGIGWLGRLHWTLPYGGLLVALVVPALALPHYFGDYQKSEYREMAAYLIAHRQPDEAVLLEAPRQHLLAKYYLPADTPIYSAPAIDLPPYWPVNAAPVVPEAMDDVIQGLLQEYSGVWLSLTAENEVDAGEFVAKYLTAVAYERDCEAWIDVRLCHFSSPQAFNPMLTTRINALFNNELALAQAAIFEDQGDLLVTLQWRAQQIPQADYRVTLRLLDSTGTVVSQRDNFPIGPLLPPTTWQLGDEKPGYLALPLPTPTLPGKYQLVVNLYEPQGNSTIPHTLSASPALASTDAIIIAFVTIGDRIVSVTANPHTKRVVSIPRCDVSIWGCSLHAHAAWAMYVPFAATE